MKYGVVLIIVVTMFICNSCQSRNGELYEYVTEWDGRGIIFPNDSCLISKDGIVSVSDIQIAGPKIFRYISPSGCSSCKLHLHLYPEILKELSDSAGIDVGFLCVVHPEDVDYIKHVLRRDNIYNLSVLIDETDTINSINQFPEIEALQTFLLDKDNKVLAIGDPAVNPQVMRLYAQILSNDTINPARIPNTILSVKKEEIHIGNVAAGDTIHISLEVRNIGQHEFVLEKVITSCDCTTADLSSASIAPGESAMLTIHFSEPDAIGEFYRIVDVFGNTEQELSIEINGTVISK